ncbi:MAG: alpha-E domain-containing protein [Acidimicrobiia bacterium]|nr:alpha-E domain-containing protein [Acidimicrobiia bacterium]
MLGKTAGGLFWMFRYLERSDNLARLIDAGVNIAAGTTSDPAEVWRSVLKSAGISDDLVSHEAPTVDQVIEQLLCDPTNPSSVRAMIAQARNTGRMVRTALSRETWESINRCWITLDNLLDRALNERDIQNVLGEIRRQSALVHGSMHGTMLRDDDFSFCRLGTCIERADYTARILDVKYYVLLPTAFHVGSPLDNVQWETILRSVSAHQSYLWLHQGEISAAGIAEYLILDDRMPRSIAFSFKKMASNLGYLEQIYEQRHRSHDLIDAMMDELNETKIEDVINNGLHEFIQMLGARNAELAQQIEADYRFYR